MKKLSTILIFLFLAFDIYLLGKILLGGKIIAILDPKGFIALQERNLIFTAVALMLLGVVPVFIFAFYVGRNFRASNAKATYSPDWGNNTKLQIFFWTFLITIMSTLSILTWVAAHRLDPHVAISSNKKPFVIQVVALRWKWLFLYPEQKIATVNSVVFPEKTPVTFEITSYNAPMNSFWIPQLGGQIYAMSGMATQTHLMADGVGTYRGSSAEISGQGFSGMVFTAKSVSSSDFTTWVSSVKQSPQILTDDTFKKLAQPSEKNPPSFYASTPDALFSTIVMHYMAKPMDNMEMGNMDN